MYAKGNPNAGMVHGADTKKQLITVVLIFVNHFYI